MKEPRFGTTHLGDPVHARATDHLPSASAADRFNKWMALKITSGVGTMWCAYAFAAVALISLPAAIASHSVIVLVAWFAQTFLQLVLLSVIIVGQNISAVAGDARQVKLLEHSEVTVDRLDEHTQGGITAILDRIDDLEERMTGKDR